MDKLKVIQSFKKAGIITCFFLVFHFSIAAPADNSWQFSPELYKAYQLVINLQVDQARAALNALPEGTNEWHKMYVSSLCETLEVLITEDHGRFDQIDKLFKERLDKVQAEPQSAESLFLQAELNLQRGFNFINLSEEFNAVLAIRKAYNLTQLCLKKYPHFIPIRKTSGVIQVMIGSVPDKFSWLMSLLGMKGSVALGQKQLQEISNSKSSLHVEGTVLYYTIKGFINQQFNEAAKGILDCLKEEPDSRLLLFLGVNMLMKESKSEQAYGLIQQLDKQSHGLQIYYIEYLRAEILLQKTEYAKAIASYQKFIKGYKSVSFKKDSYFKIGLCYLMLNNIPQAKIAFDKARKTGKDVAEPDQYAARQLEDPTLPNPKILKVRFFTDGGYYPEAEEAIKAIQPTDLKSKKEETEYFYRKARLAHKTGELTAAKIFYQQSIDMTNDQPWYFGANSALQLGYIAKDQKEYDKARKYFELALSYKRHEYKSSIDGKAKLALEQLKSLKA